VADNLNLEAYLHRLSYDGPREPSFALLDAIVSLHAAAIPYENIDVLLKRRVRLDVASLQQKLVHARRGGYCFEQNTLLEAALEALGFAVTRLTARNFRRLPVPAEPSRNHKMLRVDLPEGPYIADVGLANLTPTTPLALRLGQQQPTRHEAFRLLSHGTEFILEIKLGETWEGLVRFPLDPAPAIDFEMANWFTSTFPEGALLRNLVVARPIMGGRTAVFNRRHTVRDHNNQSTRRSLDGIDDYRDVLVRDFGLALDDAELAAIVAAMASHTADEEVLRAFV
jgi:N-hydroxyarylamine O-acetyltransferase